MNIPPVTKLFVVFIYLSIVGFIPGILLLVLRYSVFGLILIYILYQLATNSKLPKSVFFYLFLAIGWVCFLVVLSYWKGNAVLDIMILSKSYLFLLFVLIAPFMGRSGSFNYLLKHIFYAITCQAAVILLVALIQEFNGYEQTSVLLKILKTDVSTLSPRPVGFGSGIRVITRMMAFLPLGVFLAVVLPEKRTFKKICLFVINLTALYFTKSLGLYFSLVCGLLVWYLLQGHLTRKLLLGVGVLLLLAIVVLQPSIHDYQFEDIAKQKSLLIKIQQINSMAQLKGIELFFGKGLGHHFINDDRNTGDIIIEVLPVYWMVTSGAIGLGFIIFIFLFPLIHFHFNSNKMKINRKNYRSFLLIVTSQVIIFASSFSNSYIISGSTGLLFVLMYFVKLSEVSGWLRGSNVHLVK
jgi:hypothetical protein